MKKRKKTFSEPGISNFRLDISNDDMMVKKLKVEPKPCTCKHHACRGFFIPTTKNQKKCLFSVKSGVS